MFEPRQTEGPSGLADPPRPFVLRAAHLDGQTLAPGASFAIDVHVFAPEEPFLQYFTLSFLQFCRTGLGPGRGRVTLGAVDVLDAHRQPAARAFDGSGFVLPALPPAQGIAMTADEGPPIDRLCLEFTTPTELKSGGQIQSSLPFGVLVARLRDRISTLRALYDEGPLDVDFRELSEKAHAISMIRSNLRSQDVIRRSSRTGQTHSVGGFVGEVEYAGDLRPFLPYLQAGSWTGVGRHTVWGNGVYRLLPGPGV
ncbi:MAG: CRISPR system precrRNA processing endoribonuclease RAMP protein Cas6 [Bryobacterales bacterium]|nr:CRISPR system precrRNA processing endoribonuclease RAMP protein Cas6 [Bryobacterales bacterium]